MKDTCVQCYQIHVSDGTVTFYCRRNLIFTSFVTVVGGHNSFVISMNVAFVVFLWSFQKFRKHADQTQKRLFMHTVVFQSSFYSHLHQISLAKI